MRILAISSSYGTGGYGQPCEKVSKYLAGYGHEISVLTCPGEKSYIPDTLHVNCTLLRDPNWSSRWPGYVQFYFSHRRRQKHNLGVVAQKLLEFSPNVVFVWQGTGLDRALFAAAKRARYPVVYRLCDYGPTITRRILGLLAQASNETLVQLSKGSSILAGVSVNTAQQQTLACRFRSCHLCQ